MKPFAVNLKTTIKSQSGIPFSYSKSKLVNNLLTANDIKFDADNNKTSALLDVLVEEEHSVIIFAKNKTEARQQCAEIEYDSANANSSSRTVDIQGLIGKYGTITNKEKLSVDFHHDISSMCSGVDDLHGDKFRLENAEHSASTQVISCNEMPLTNGKGNSKFKIEQKGVSKERRTYMLYYKGFKKDGDKTTLVGLTNMPTPKSKSISFLVDWTYKLDSDYITDNIADNDRTSEPLKFEIKQLATVKGLSSPDVLTEHSLKKVRGIISNSQDFEVKKGVVLRDYLVARIEKNDIQSNQLTKS